MSADDERWIVVPDHEPGFFACTGDDVCDDKALYVPESYITDRGAWEGRAACERHVPRPEPEIEGTDAAKEAFRAKMRAWRAEGGTPGYIGPRAGRDA